MVFKHKLVQIIIKEKLQAINEFGKGHFISVLENEHGVGRSAVFEIVKNKDKLHKFVSQLNNESATTSKRIIRKSNQMKRHKMLPSKNSAVEIEPTARVYK